MARRLPPVPPASAPRSTTTPPPALSTRRDDRSPAGSMPTPAPRSTTTTPVPRSTTTTPVVVTRPARVAGARRLLAEEVDLTLAEKKRILSVWLAIQAGNVERLFVMPERPSRRDLKRAYYELSKLYHPDRFYGRALGSFGPMLDEVFATLSRHVRSLGDARAPDGEGAAIAPRRRKHERHPFTARVTIRHRARPFEQRHTVDIGAGGLFVPTDSRHEVGEQVDLRLVVPGAGPLSLRGRVVHVRAEGDAARPAGIGIEVAAPTVYDASVMQRLVNLARRGERPGPEIAPGSRRRFQRVTP